MNRFAAAAGAVVACLLLAAGARAAPDARALPMQFDLWSEAPNACGASCRSWVSASGAITTDTARDFEAFAKRHKLDGQTIALDSDGGSVLGALALGRAIRRLGMTTTVGKSVASSAAENGVRRGRLVPKAYCESMCAFVLLAGVERHVPAEARVMVHQIWLGDRRDDPTAANYSAEDLVIVQRDIGRLAQYTVEMGGGIDLLEIALKIPPWEPMRLLSRKELRGMKIVTADEMAEVNSGASTNSAALANGARASVNGRGWTVYANAERAKLGRIHPLTVEGEEIGTFELNVGCEESGRDYTLTYIEQRRSLDAKRRPATPSAIEIRIAGRSVPLKILSAQPTGKTQELELVASGRLSADMLRVFAEASGRSLTVETSSDDLATAIRVGNAGFARALPQLTGSCAGRPRIGNTARNDLRDGG
jgi:hypothetical protein